MLKLTPNTVLVLINDFVFGRYYVVCLYWGIGSWIWRLSFFSLICSLELISNLFYTYIMKKSKENSEHYKWGDNCSGWHLVQSQSLSVIEELMPPNTQEVKHYHKLSQQFFRILHGKATFEIENEIVQIEKGNGIHITTNKS